MPCGKAFVLHAQRCNLPLCSSYSPLQCVLRMHNVVDAMYRGQFKL